MRTTKKKISIKDVANKAGVSTTLVSFVLNGKSEQHRVGSEATERIMQIAKELNYKPNTAAKSLRDGHSRILGVVVSDIANPFFAQLARCIEATVEKYGYMAQFSSSDEDSDRADALINTLISRGIDSLIVVPCAESNATIQSLVSQNIPLVLFDRYFPDIDTNFVCLNNHKSAYDATRHLIDEDFRNIGFIAYNTSLQHMTDRIAGYKDAMISSGLEQNTHIAYVSHPTLKKDCKSAIDRMLKEKVDAIVFATNSITTECLYLISKRGIRIPEDMGIVGYDGGGAFDFFYSPLSYIQQPLEMMAQKAVEISINQLDPEKDLRQHIEATGTLVIRESSLRKSLKNRK